MSYLMESAEEGKRLVAQERANPSSLRLLQAGLARGQRVVDLGCGAGAVMPTILEIVGAEGWVTGVDMSPERVEEARKLLGAASNVEVRRGALPKTGLPDASFDFSWSQFVFEYLGDPEAALREMMRVTRPGGTVAVADVDRVGLDFWPRSAVLEEGLELFTRALASTGFDFFIGRKLFTYFRKAGLEDITVNLSPLYISAGADERLVTDYTQRFEVLAPLATKNFGDEKRYWQFAHAYLALLADPDALKYAVVLTVAGRRSA